jgi:integrase
MANKKRTIWSKTVGERPHRIRVYEPFVGSPLYRSVFVNSKENRKSLGHRDRERAVKEAYALLAKVLDNQAVFERDELTLGMLQHLYLSSPAFDAKKVVTQKNDRRNFGRVIQFLGAHRSVMSLDEADVQRYMKKRSSGSDEIQKVSGRLVRARTVQADLDALCIALNWATRQKRPSGRWLLEQNPLRAVRLPKEQNPRRPVISHPTYLALLNVAPSVHPLLPLALIVAEGSGRRLSGWRLLKWGDIDFSTSTILWRAKNDKKGYEQRVPMSQPVREALLKAMNGTIKEADAWVFPSPRDYFKPCDRHLLDSWLRKAYTLAGKEKGQGSLWHALRRKWATERKHHPVSDVAAAGGWRDVGTLIEAYMRTDTVTVKRVVENPERLNVSA